MTWVHEAQVRARRRKSPWNLMLIPAVVGPWLFFSWFTAVGFGELHRLLHPGREFAILPEGLSGILMAVAPLFAWLVPAMVAGNLLVATIRPAKRVLDVEAASVPSTDLWSSNRTLLKVASVLTPTALFLGLVGALVEL